MFWKYFLVDVELMNDFCSVFISQKDTYEALNAIKNSGGDGVVLWGSSSDLNSK